ncbi:MAG: hypothetical protein A2664_04515 [Candidatus Taylorbacteria bacterium RIFCSPHIGHO2_01_FULL_46_22b]|uniref:Uncharacterized protein n=1 Tax=Candidatus Taylorbacteria bacterium RIFCSPHIGHO2_01_FULL_46_22b TaxID=1802301 RepID=A0A1G2M6R7_9BACT|nr:MAG: hypothetical protein A2664_04515 [Candidatus Taylorbacteria bacterium RIFCSPHIGHO2_01_FULL_46_22b]
MARIDTRSALKFSLIAIALLTLLIYGYFQASSIITGPVLTISSPRNGQTVSSTSPSVLLEGTATGVSFLTINGLQVFTNEKGIFARKLLLTEGYNIITVEAQDKFKRSVKKELQLIVR